MNIVELFRIGSKVSNLIEIAVDYGQEKNHLYAIRKVVRQQRPSL